jgi:hypothetical protein
VEGERTRKKVVHISLNCVNVTTVFQSAEPEPAMDP